MMQELDEAISAYYAEKRHYPRMILMSLDALAELEEELSGYTMTTLEDWSLRTYRGIPVAIFTEGSGPPFELID